MGTSAFLARAEAPANAAAGPGLWTVSNTGELLDAVAEMKARGKERTDGTQGVAAVGGTIRLAPGVFVLREAIEFENMPQINIIGSGWSTVVRRTGSGNAFMFRDCGFTLLRDMLVVGDIEADEGSGIIFLGQASSCSEVDHCRIQHFADSGVRFEATAERPMSSTTVKYCHFIGNRTDQLYAHCSNDFYILANQFGTHQSGQFDPKGPVPRTGVVLNDCSAGTYSQNYHWDHQVALRMGPHARFNRIQNNRFEESRESGIVIGVPGGGASCDYNIFMGNTIHSNCKFNAGAFSAVVAHQASEITFIGNQIFSWNANDNWFKSCLEVSADCHHWIIKDNILRHHDPQHPAILTHEGGRHIIKDNLGG
ncbi:MAG: right-handed parallel beta-helix repeat-containing protein [Phycisphaerae bacterium]|nr:right-handed parallel beta-helix repeat-containing protein [Phycisphaerae bacterium]